MEKENNTIGEILRTIREEKGLLLREVAAAIHIDPTLLSKIERGERLPTKEQVLKLAKFFKADKNTFMVAWLSDKLVYEVQDEDNALKALLVAEEKIRYQTKNKK